MTDATPPNEKPAASTFAAATAKSPEAQTSAPAATATAMVKQTHPVRGVLWGLLFGLGLALVLILARVISLSLVPALVVLVIGTVAGTAWSLFGPAKAAS